jgi:hypothetical protein
VREYINKIITSKNLEQREYIVVIKGYIEFWDFLKNFRGF